MEIQKLMENDVKAKSIFSKIKKNIGPEELNNIVSKKKIDAKTPIDDFYRIYHIFLTTYGWIPFCEFLSMPIDVTMRLFNEIKFDVDNTNKSLNKANRVVKKHG
jgi:hypothetical protein